MKNPSDDYNRMKCVYAGPEYFQSKYPENRQPEMPMMCVYRGPEPAPNGLWTESSFAAKPQVSKPLDNAPRTACRECGEILPGKSRFCNMCGTRLEEPKTYFCPLCMTAVKFEQPFCTECGTKLIFEKT